MFDEEYLQETLRITFGDEEYYFVPKGITRYDYYHTHGWWVRVRRDNVPFAQMFSDGVHGGIDESLKAAIRYRHEILAAFPLSPRPSNYRTIPDDPEERITRVNEKGKKQRYIAWKARWYDENHKIQSKNFSVLKFGEEKAKELALAEATKNHNREPKSAKLIKPHDPYEKQSFNKLLREDVKVLATIDSEPTKKSDTGEFSVSEDPFAFEGEKTLELHLNFERDRKLRSEKIAVFFSEHGKVFCELCNFNFKEMYPFLEKDIIEVHHIVPLSKLTKGTITRLSDLMLLCSNCHFAVHQGDAEDNLLSAMEHFESREKSYV